MMKDKVIILHRQDARSTLMTVVVLLFLDVPMVKVIEKEQGVWAIQCHTKVEDKVGKHTLLPTVLHQEGKKVEQEAKDELW